MSAILIFLLVVGVISGWWLSHQRLTSKPWLEVGLDSVVEGTDGVRMPKAKVGLIVFLAVVGALFALFASGFFMRMEYPDWQSMPLPRIVWFSTGFLVMGSVSLHFALNDIRKAGSSSYYVWIANAGFANLVFLFGQARAWQHLVDSGYALTGNPANSFFYMITAIHGLHILGGLVALGRTSWMAGSGAPKNKLQASLELCALYWHFLLFVWLIMLVILVGWANDLFDLCTQLLL